LAIDAKKNWRKDVYPLYKAQRAKIREESKIDYGEYYKEVDNLISALDKYFPFKVLKVHNAEADDIAGILTKEYKDTHKITLITSDKDWKQLLIGNHNVSMYDPIKREYQIVNDNDAEILNSEFGDISRFTLKHTLKGDESDNIPKVNAKTELSKNFLSYLKDNGHNLNTLREFKELGKQKASSLINNYDVYVKITAGKKKGQYSDKKDIFKVGRLGDKGIEKILVSVDTFNDFIYSHELYKDNFKRNLELVSFDKIPKEIYDLCISNYKETKIRYNPDGIAQYLQEESLNDLAKNAQRFYDSRYEPEFASLGELFDFD
jgi:5'-3' exonuclease